MEPEARNSAVGWHWNIYLLAMKGYSGLFGYFQHGEGFFFSARGGVQYPRIFSIHSRIIPFYSRNFIFITQEITNTLLNNFEGPWLLGIW